MIVCDRLEANPRVGVKNDELDACAPWSYNQLMDPSGKVRLTSLIEVAKLGEGLALPSMLLLLLYGLGPAWPLINVDSPRMLPRFNVFKRSDCCGPRVLRLRIILPPGLRDDVDALAPNVLP